MRPITWRCSCRLFDIDRRAACWVEMRGQEKIYERSTHSTICACAAGGVAGLGGVGGRPVVHACARPHLELFSGVDVIVGTTADQYSGPDCSLRDALQTINNGVDHGGCTRINNLTAFDRVLLSSGTYSLTIRGADEDFNVTGDLDIRRSVIISATGATSPTVTANPGWDDRILDVVTGTVTIKGLIIRGGAVTTSTLGGGGVLIEHGASLSLNDSQVTGNSALSSGGGIDNDRGIVMLSHVTLAGNTTTNGSGGGIYNGGTLTLSNVTLDSNHAAARGGGIYNGGTLTATDVTLAGNSGYDGGGIANDYGSLTLSNVTLDSNHADGYGGGIENLDGSTMTLYSSTLSNNSVNMIGGGIENGGGTLILYSSTLSGNSSNGIGGGIDNSGSGIITLENSTVNGNFATSYGGGLYNFGGGIITLENSTFNDNSSTDSGGGLYNFGIATLENSTLSGNSATSFGGGLYNDDIATLRNVTLSNNSATQGGALYIPMGRTTVLTNTILAYSPSGGNCSGTLTISKFTISSDNTCALVGNIKGMDPNGLDPLLTALGNYGGSTKVHMLELGSPAIDGIVGSDAPSTDQRGFSRPIGASYDIGAVERQPSDTDLLPWVYLPLLRR